MSKVWYRAELNHGADELQAMWKGVYLSLLWWAGVYALSPLRFRRIRSRAFHRQRSAFPAGKSL